MRLPSTTRHGWRATLVLVLFLCVAPACARNTTWFDRDSCRDFIGWLQEDPAWDKNTSEYFAFDSASQVLFDDRDNMTLTRRGCEEFCGPHSYYWDAGPRLTTWIVPVLLLLSNVELSPIDKKRFMTIIHALGDPIDSFWSMIHKIYMWDRLYMIGLQKSPKTVLQAEDEQLGVWFKIRSAVIKLLVLMGMARPHTRRYNHQHHHHDEQQAALNPDHEEDHDSSQPLTQEHRAKIIATVLSGFEEISGAKIESDMHYHMITYKLGRLGESDESPAKFEEWRRCARLLADARTNEYLRTVLAIAVYFLGLIAAFVPDVGGGQTTPPGGRIGSAVFLSWLVPLALLSNRIGAFTSRRACLHIMKGFVAATSETRPEEVEAETAGGGVDRPRFLSNLFPAEDSGKGPEKGPDTKGRQDSSAVSDTPDDPPPPPEGSSSSKPRSKKTGSVVHFAEDTSYTSPTRTKRRSSSYAYSPYSPYSPSGSSAKEQEYYPSDAAPSAARDSTSSDIRLLRHHSGASISSASDLGLMNEIYAQRTTSYHEDGHEMASLQGRDYDPQSHPATSTATTTTATAQPAQSSKTQSMTQVSLVRFTSWDDYFASQQWLGAIYTYRPWKVQYRHVDHRTHAKRTSSLMALAGLFPVLASALGASVILWYAVPQGFSCRNVWIVTVFGLWLLSAVVTTAVYRISDRRHWHREERSQAFRRGTGDGVLRSVGGRKGTTSSQRERLRRRDPEQTLWMVILAKDFVIAAGCVLVIFLSTAGLFNDCYCWSAWMTWHDAAVVPLNTDGSYVANATNIYSAVVVGTIGAQVVFFFGVTGYYWRGLSIVRWHEDDKREEWRHESRERVQWTGASELLFWYWGEELERMERGREGEEERVRRESSAVGGGHLGRRISGFEGLVARTGTWMSFGGRGSTSR